MSWLKQVLMTACRAGQASKTPNGNLASLLNWLTSVPLVFSDQPESVPVPLMLASTWFANGGAGMTSTAAAGAAGPASPPQADQARQTLNVAENNVIGSPGWFLSVATFKARDYETI
ncbi:hypothetical protein [Massilia aquatica]|nr:hypothetical protein [Massilia aquatica]